MTTKIKNPKDIHKVIQYNENKVGQGVAECLYAGNFFKEAADLNLREKKAWFDHFLDLDRRVQCSTLHIPVSFAPGENIPKDTLVAIAREYMDRIGFGDQPYLVYQHFDTAHPHLHIVTISIRADGTYIDQNFIGRDKSEPARKAIEEKYHLVKAQGQKKAQPFQFKPLPVEKLQYGKQPTKQAITNALEYILENYRYRSLPELNAILRLYNLRANNGQPGGRIRAHKGLLYQMLNEKGEGVGIPIKASSIHFKPGLAWLAQKFEGNLEIDPVGIQHVRLAVDAALRKKSQNWSAFTAALHRQQVVAVPYFNARKNFLYGLSFVDLEGKVVLKASDLGKAYSTAAILQRLGLDNFLQPVAPGMANTTAQAGQDASLFPPFKSDRRQPEQSRSEALDILFRPEDQAERLPYELSQKAQQKKKNKSKKI